LPQRSLKVCRDETPAMSKAKNQKLLAFDVSSRSKGPTPSNGNCRRWWSSWRRSLAAVVVAALAVTVAVERRDDGCAGHHPA